MKSHILREFVEPFQPPPPNDAPIFISSTHLRQQPASAGARCRDKDARNMRGTVTLVGVEIYHRPPVLRGMTA